MWLRWTVRPWTLLKLDGLACDQQMPLYGRSDNGKQSEKGKIQVRENNCNYASASAKNFISFTRGERKNCPAFFPIIWPDHTESADFLALELVKLQASYYFQPLFTNTFFCRVSARSRRPV
jgi:hypothetical protein